MAAESPTSPEPAAAEGLHTPKPKPKPKKNADSERKKQLDAKLAKAKEAAQTAKERLDSAKAEKDAATVVLHMKFMAAKSAWGEAEDERKVAKREWREFIMNRGNKKLQQSPRDAKGNEELQQIREEVKQKREVLQEKRAVIQQDVVDALQTAREKVGEKAKDSWLAFAFVMVSSLRVLVWLAHSVYGALRLMAALVLKDHSHWMADVAKEAHYADFIEWVAATCDKPHLKESLICQLSHMKYDGGWGAPRPENWLVEQLSLLKVAQQGVDFCPEDGHGHGLRGIHDNLLGSPWVRFALKVVGKVTTDAHKVVDGMIQGKIGLSKLDDEIVKLPYYDKWLKKVLHKPLGDWGMKLADATPPQIVCANRPEANRADLLVAVIYIGFGTCALLVAFELLMQARAGKAAPLPASFPAKLLRDLWLKGTAELGRALGWMKEQARNVWAATARANNGGTDSSPPSRLSKWAEEVSIGLQEAVLEVAAHWRFAASVLTFALGVNFFILATLSLRHA